MRRTLTRLRADNVLTSLIAGQLITAVGALVANVIVARSIGPSSRGEIALVLQVVYAATAFSTLGRPQAILVKLSPHKSPLISAFRLAAFPGLLALAASVVLAITLRTSLSWVELFTALVCQTLAGISLAFLRAVSILTKKPGLLLKVIVASQVLLTAGGVGLLVTNRGSVASWLAVYSLSLLVPNLLGILVGLKKVNKSSNCDGFQVKDTARWGIRVFPAYFLGHVSDRLDRFLIPLLSSYAQLGLYSTVTTALEVVLWPVRQFADSRIGVWRDKNRQGKLSVRKLIVASFTACSSLALVIGLILHVALVPVFGSAYAEARRLIPIISLAIALRAQGVLLVAIGLAIGWPTIGNTFHIASVAVFTVGLVLLIPVQGAFGAGLAACLASIVGFGAVALILKWPSKK